MYGSLFLPLLSLLLSALPAVLCVDDVQGTPTLIFESHFGDAKNPLLASVEVERLNNIKGNRSEEVGVLGPGTVSPRVSRDATTGIDYLEFFPPATPPTLPTGVCGVKPGFGGGEVVYYPFRLDHNTVYNNKAQPVEDNGWIFSWRAAWGAMRTQECSPGTTNPLYDNGDDSHETIYDQLNNAWQVVYSFPTASNLNNLVVAQRTRAPVGGVTPVELAVFVSSDPTGTQTQDYNYLGTNPLTAYPVAIFPIPEAKVSNNQWRSYVLYVPMPDRSPVFKVTGNFYSSTGDYPGLVTAGYAPADWGSSTASTVGSRDALRTIFKRQIETQWSIWENAFKVSGASAPLDIPIESATIADNSNRVAWTFVAADSSLPNNGLGSFSFTFEVRRGAQHPHLDNFIRHFVKYFATFLKTQFSNSPYTWDSVDVNYRAKGALKASDITLWFDGERVNQATYQKVAPKTLMNWLRVATTSSTEDAWDHLWSGGGDSVFNQVFGITNPDDDLVHNPTYTRAFEFETPDTTAKVSLINHEPSNSFAFFFTLADRPGTDCIDKVDYTADVATWVANAARRFHERMDEWAVSSIFPTTAYGFTGIPTDDTFLGFVSASHFDVKQQYTTGACTIQISIRIRDPEDGLGEMMVLNSDVDTGYSTKRQAPAVAAPFTGPFFVIGGHPTVWNPDSDLGLETYRGVVQNLRLADVRIYTTAATSAAKSVTESFLKVLVECGDGQLDGTEVCDKSDKSCTGDCTCPLRTVPKAPKGCTYCGNGVIDYLIGEICDVFEDPWCASDCTACKEAGMVVDEVKLPSNGHATQNKGRCSYCGNGKLDINVGEICDKKDPNCNADCKGCKAGWFPTGNAVGSCFRCGNKVLDAGEICDIGFNPHVCASDCSSCKPGFIPDGNGSCTACGNGKVDEGEACDKALSACQADCSACVQYHVTGHDGSCTRCGNGRLDAGEMCDASQPNCMADCSGCTDGRVPSGNSLGTCTLCGNGRIDANGDLGLPEACDADPNCLGCNDCRAPFVLAKQGGNCVLCGNGRLDAGEVCDSAQMGCDSSCLACGEDWMSVSDAATNPTGLCFPTTCSGATGADGECTCQ